MKNDAISLTTSRLILRTPDEGDHFALEAFEEKAHLSPWRAIAEAATVDHKAEIKKWNQEWEENRAVRFFVFLREDPEAQIIGLCNFSQLVRGPFQACYLGYQIDAAYEGKGIMSEAVARAIQYMFEEQNLHRIMANYIPANKKSGRLLQKLGFVIEGLAKQYLLINGRWEDHILTSLTNPRWVSPVV